MRARVNSIRRNDEDMIKNAVKLEFRMKNSLVSKVKGPYKQDQEEIGRIISNQLAEQNSFALIKNPMMNAITVTNDEVERKKAMTTGGAS